MVKIGFFDFWGYKDSPVDWFEIDDFILRAFREYGINYLLVDPSDEECDIVFKSVFKCGKQIKGNPIIIGYTGEPIYNIQDADLSLTFDDDSETNLYYPTWQTQSRRYYENTVVKNADEKTLFCSFAQGVEVKKRTETYLYLCENYKHIISYGSIYCTAGYQLKNYKKNFKLFQDAHRKVKFNMCFENTETHGTKSFITERIIHAYAFGTVPIYCGAENVVRWFNPYSFINCNGLTNEEILEKIAEVDNNDNLYRDMLYAKPFNEDINWKEYSYARLISFLKSKNII